MTQNKCEQLSREKWILLEELCKLYEWWFLWFLSHRHVLRVTDATEGTFVKDLGLTTVTDRLGELCGPLPDNNSDYKVLAHKKEADFVKEDEKKKQKGGLSR